MRRSSNGKRGGLRLGAPQRPCAGTASKTTQALGLNRRWGDLEIVDGYRKVLAARGKAPIAGMFLGPEEPKP